jgi:hypothetical protein
LFFRQGFVTSRSGIATLATSGWLNHSRRTKREQKLPRWCGFYQNQNTRASLPSLRYAAGEQFSPTPVKENPFMKKLSHLMLMVVSLVLTSYALAQGAQDPLVQIVRNATQRYQNVANASPDYGPAAGCVSGPDHGAMGIHYVNGSLLNGETLLGDSQQLDPTRPQALIYEPQANGELKLVAVEFIILASALPPGAAPEVDGHLMLYIDGQSPLRPNGTPNRYGLPAIFELHVWAWKDNPEGAFVDWNNHVTCANQ